MKIYLDKNNGFMICSLDKVEIRLFEVQVRGVGLYYEDIKKDIKKLVS